MQYRRQVILLIMKIRRIWYVNMSYRTDAKSKSEASGDLFSQFYDCTVRTTHSVAVIKCQPTQQRRNTTRSMSRNCTITSKSDSLYEVLSPCSYQEVSPVWKLGSFTYILFGLNFTKYWNESLPSSVVLFGFAKTWKWGSLVEKGEERGTSFLV